MLISKNTASAYYQREEVAAAIALARKAGDRHRVVPLDLNVDPAHPDVPYGLRLKHGISLGVDVDLARAAARLLSTSGALLMLSVLLPWKGRLSLKYHQKISPPNCYLPRARPIM